MLLVAALPMLCSRSVSDSLAQGKGSDSVHELQEVPPIVVPLALLRGGRVICDHLHAQRRKTPIWCFKTTMTAMCVFVRTTPGHLARRREAPRKPFLGFPQCPEAAVALPHVDGAVVADSPPTALSSVKDKRT